MNKNIIITIIVIILAGAGFWVWQVGVFTKVSVPPTLLPSGIILFYSPDCPHCQDVEAFIKANNIDQKVKYTHLEVAFGFKTSSQLVANSELALQLAKECKLDVSNGVGIPFLYDGNGKCYLGEVDVPAFFKTQAGIQ